jgi:hypothetical protein
MASVRVWFNRTYQHFIIRKKGHKPTDIVRLFWNFAKKPQPVQRHGSIGYVTSNTCSISYFDRIICLLSMTKIYWKGIFRSLH